MTAAASASVRGAFGRADLLALAAALAWGGSFTAAKPLVAAIDPVLFAGLRYLVVALLLFAVLALRREVLGVAGRELPALLGLGLLGFALYQALWSYGLHLTTASKASILISTTPLFGAVLGRLRGERLGPLAWFGLVLAFCGIALVVTDGGLTSFGGGSALGDALFVLNALLWALFTAASAPVVRRLGLVRATAYASLFGGGLLFLGSIPAALRQDWSGLSPDLAWNFLFLTVVAGAGAQLAYYAGLRSLGVARAMVYLYLVPVFGVAIALGLLGESFSAIQAAGAAAVLSGVVLTQRGARPVRSSDPSSRPDS